MKKHILKLGWIFFVGVQLFFNPEVRADLKEFINPGDNYSFIGENSSDMSGHSVATAGDVDGDGLDDILIGAYDNDDGGSSAGKTYLILGSSLDPTNPTIDLSAADYSFIGENYFDYSGYSVSTAGDVDGDGLDDILIGATHNDDGGSYAGKTYLILGSSLDPTNPSISLSAADYFFVGENAGDISGLSISTAGDVDGDGLDDILIGAYGNDDGGSYAGKTYLILGSSLDPTSPNINLSAADYSFIGENAGDYSGYNVATAGDIDGDGLDDILIGARYNDDGGPDAGKTYLVLGWAFGVNEVLNPSADEGLDFWTSSGTANTSTERSGNNVFILPSEGDSLSQDITVPYGASGVTIKANLRCTRPLAREGYPFVTVYVRDSSGSTLHTLVSSAVSSRSFTTITLSETSLDSSSAELEIVLERTNRSRLTRTNTAIFDDIEVIFNE